MTTLQSVLQLEVSFSIPIVLHIKHYLDGFIFFDGRLFSMKYYAFSISGVGALEGLSDQDSTAFL
jgi:hypothetical protein